MNVPDRIIAAAQQFGDEGIAAAEAFEKAIEGASAAVNALTREVDDGGLARRQMFHGLKDRMAVFKRGQKMICAMCNEAQKANPDMVHNVRNFRSWSALRSHLIDHHGIDRREIPE